jgi:hydrogenase small subunit
MDEPPGGKVSTTGSAIYGRSVKSLRKFTQRTLNKEPKWRERGPELKTGYQPRGR